MDQDIKVHFRFEIHYRKWKLRNLSSRLIVLALRITCDLARIVKIVNDSKPNFQNMSQQESMFKHLTQ